jgi:hypothetical protein
MKGMIVLILTGFTLFAYSQDIVQVSIGANYANQVYYTLANDDMTVIGNNAWDLAFAQTESFEAGIHVNESITISFMGTSPSTLLFLAPGQDFNDPIDPEMVGDSLYNDELSWANGALNVPRNPEDFADFGWGFYNTDNHAIIGNRVFVIQLRDGSYRKFMIESLISGVYTLKYANLDGSSEKTVSIDKNDFAEKPLILFSFLEDKVLDNLPEGYDLIFQRYSDLDPSNAGVFVEYTVTGILAAPGVLSAQANNIDDPEEVDHTIYLDSLEQQIDIIGQDWKFFSFESGWNILEDVTFFVKTNDNHLWQIYIYDFEGSSSGTYTFAKWDHGILAGTGEIGSGIDGMSLAPNPVPAGSGFSLVLETGEALPAHISIIHPHGQTVMSYEKSLQQGLNGYRLNTSGLARGIYYVQVKTPIGQVSQPLVVK